MKNMSIWKNKWYSGSYLFYWFKNSNEDSLVDVVFFFLADYDF